MIDSSKIIRASFKLGASDGKEIDPKGEVKGYKIFCESPNTGEKLVVKEFTKCDALEARYNAACEEIAHLQQYVDQQKSENEVLHRKVNDLKRKLSQAWQERNKLRNELKAAKGELSKAEKETPKLDLYLEKLYQLFDEGSTGMFENPKGFWSGEGEPKEGELVFKRVAGTVRIVPFSKDDELKEQE